MSMVVSCFILHPAGGLEYFKYASFYDAVRALVQDEFHLDVLTSVQFEIVHFGGTFVPILVSIRALLFR